MTQLEIIEFIEGIENVISRLPSVGAVFRDPAIDALSDDADRMLLSLCNRLTDALISAQASSHE